VRGRQGHATHLAAIDRHLNWREGFFDRRHLDISSSRVSVAAMSVEDSRGQQQRVLVPEGGRDETQNATQACLE